MYKYSEHDPQPLSQDGKKTGSLNGKSNDHRDCHRGGGNYFVFEDEFLGKCKRRHCI